MSRPPPPQPPPIKSVEKALKDYEAAALKLRTAYGLFDNGKNQDPRDVAVATAAPLIFVEAEKATLDVALAVERDRIARCSTFAMVFFTLVIAVATGIQACAAARTYDLAKSAKPVVCAETRVSLDGGL